MIIIVLRDGERAKLWLRAASLRLLMMKEEVLVFES